MSKKIEKLIKSRKSKKKIIEKTEPKKKLIKPIKILKKPAGSVQFWFYKQKTEPNRTDKNRKKTESKPSQTGKTEPNQKN
jgi:hypothetical protein